LGALLRKGPFVYQVKRFFAFILLKTGDLGLNSWLLRSKGVRISLGVRPISSQVRRMMSSPAKYKQVNKSLATHRNMLAPPF
jgi:hypothetical protein